jgi:hypothetical protein
VRVSVSEFVVNASDYVVDGEGSFFGANLGVEHHLDQYITKFLG